MFFSRQRLTVWATLLVGPSNAFVLLQRHGTLSDSPNAIAKKRKMDDSFSLFDNLHNYYTIDGGEDDFGPGSWHSLHHQQKRYYDKGPSMLRAPDKPASAYMEVVDGDDEDYGTGFGAFGGDIMDDDEDEETFLSFPGWVTDKTAGSSSVGFTGHDSSISSSSSSSFGGVPGPPPVGMFLNEKQSQLDGTVLDIFKDWKPPEEEEKEQQASQSGPTTEDGALSSSFDEFQRDEVAWADTYEEIHNNVHQESPTAKASPCPGAPPPSSFSEQETFGIWENALQLPKESSTLASTQEDEAVEEDTVVMMELPVRFVENVSRRKSG
jgi:hypothetical protein